METAVVSAAAAAAAAASPVQIHGLCTSVCKCACRHAAHIVGKGCVDRHSLQYLHDCMPDSCVAGCCQSVTGETMKHSNGHKCAPAAATWKNGQKTLEHEDPGVKSTSFCLSWVRISAGTSPDGEGSHAVKLTLAVIVIAAIARKTGEVEEPVSRFGMPVGLQFVS